MKIRKMILGVLMVVASVTTVSSIEPPALLEAYPVEPLNEAEREAISYMLEEEKVARDVYVALGETWTTPIFTNIANAEQVHMDRVRELVERYELPVPSTMETPGEFENGELQDLYNTLTVRGRESYEAALRVGVTIEETDLADLRTSLEEVDNADIRAVFDRLVAGSENHLAAFSRQLDTGSASADVGAGAATGRNRRASGRVGGNSRGPRSRW